MTTIKIAQISDVPALAKLARKIWEEYYTALLGEEQVQYMLGTIQSEEAIADDLRNGKVYWIAQENGQDVGYVGYELQDGQLFLSKFYIQSSVRGKGVGRFLFDALKKTAQENKLTKISLTVNKHNEDTIAVYKKLGFKKVADQVADIGEGFSMDDYVLSYTV